MKLVMVWFELSVLLSSFQSMHSFQFQFFTFLYLCVYWFWFINVTLVVAWVYLSLLWFGLSLLAILTIGYCFLTTQQIGEEEEMVSVKLSVKGQEFVSFHASDRQLVLDKQFFFEKIEMRLQTTFFFGAVFSIFKTCFKKQVLKKCDKILF